MKNKGLLHSKANPLAFRKDAVPEELPNRITADQDTSGTKQPKQTLDPTSDAAPSAPNRTLTPKQRVLKTTAVDKGHTTSARYTLRLAIDVSVADAIDRLFSGLEGSAKSSAKKGFIRRFAAELNINNLKKASYSPNKPTSYRLDLVLADDFKDAILAVENTNPLEPTSAVIARNLAPSFIAYVKRIEKGT